MKRRTIVGAAVVGVLALGATVQVTREEFEHMTDVVGVLQMEVALLNVRQKALVERVEALETAGNAGLDEAPEPVPEPDEPVSRPVTLGMLPNRQALATSTLAMREALVKQFVGRTLLATANVQTVTKRGDVYVVVMHITTPALKYLVELHTANEKAAELRAGQRIRCRHTIVHVDLMTGDRCGNISIRDNGAPETL